MTQIICLANSQKHGERCIAGIEPSTSEWIRPVSDLDDGRVPRNMCLIDGEELRLLDILEIPLATTGRGYECENRSVLPGKWQRVGRASPNDVVQYCELEIIHSQWLNYVPFSFLQSLPFHYRRTLQLIRTSGLNIYQYQDTKKWEASLPIASRQRMKAKITDLALIDKLNVGGSFENECLVTISLGQPWRKTDSDELACWKLIAGVIELSESDLILVEIKRLDWTIDQAREYLQRTYNKRSRQQLTTAEITQFLNYLRFLPTPSNSPPNFDDFPF